MHEPQLKGHNRTFAISTARRPPDPGISAAGLAFGLGRDLRRKKRSLRHGKAAKDPVFAVQQAAKDQLAAVQA